MISNNFISSQPPILLQSSIDPEIFIEILEWIDTHNIPKLQQHKTFNSFLSEGKLLEKDKKTKTVISFYHEHKIKNHKILMVKLSEKNGANLENKKILFSVGQKQTIGKTDSNGLTHVLVDMNSVGNTYEMKAVFEGDNNYESSELIESLEKDRYLEEALGVEEEEINPGKRNRRTLWQRQKENPLKEKSAIGRARKTVEEFDKIEQDKRKIWAEAEKDNQKKWINAMAELTKENKVAINKAKKIIREAEELFKKTKEL